MKIDPTQAGQSVIEALLNNQWFVAAVILFFFLCFLAATVYVINKVGKMLDANQARMDARDASWQERLDKKEAENNARLDKRDDEVKELVHNYYNTQGTTSLTLQALGQSLNGVGERLEDVEARGEKIENLINSKLEARAI
jgi:cbb3-type cytochrome oxidase subunit 3